ncbi:MAG TPA: class I adenylate cyclase [Syntrophales bacterium]|nr:class I adenylate cyclase [Syntrophales bacterium]
MLPITILQNKKAYLSYNNFRKGIFTELFPRESEVILYLLPWLLSVNHPSFPGYVRNLKKPVKVFNIDYEKEIIKREPVFKRMFGFHGAESLTRTASETFIIQGIYTIGSMGTVSSTSRSDCDIWICIDKNDFNGITVGQFHQKINLIKDWFDANIKVPVYFFVSDVSDIKNCSFGSVDFESSGSSQKNVLKEEFYRTSIRICGKIPFWWVCFDRENKIDYEEFVSGFSGDAFGEYEFIDFGDSSNIPRDEFFGAALWQYNKSLTHPLKSIMKMLLLKMCLDEPGKGLLCNRFRSLVLEKKSDEFLSDPSVFTLREILEHAKGYDAETFEFIKKCCYLRYDVKLYSKNVTLKEKYVVDLFKQYTINRDEIHRLNRFTSWNFSDQIEVGSKIFSVLLKIYTDIVAMKDVMSGEIAPQDLTLIGRKLSSCLAGKRHKISILRKPIDNLNLPSLIFSINGNIWQVSYSMDKSLPIISNANIMHCIAFLVWNDIYLQQQIRMLPNSTTVSIQEIINLAKKMKDVFGVYDVSNIDLENFLAEEKYLRMLLVISFEASGDIKDRSDFCLLYLNNWGELFLWRFNSPEELNAFLSKHHKQIEGSEMNYYVRRSSLYYEKIIERTKRLVANVVKVIQKV